MAGASEEDGDPLVPSGERRSTFALLRNVIMSMTHVVEDSTELVGTSVREELERFRLEMARHALSMIALVTGASLVSAGIAIFLSEVLGSWPITLVVFGGIYIAAGAALYRFGVSSGGSNDGG